jgi:hypothetical protein
MKTKTTCILSIILPLIMFAVTASAQEPDLTLGFGGSAGMLSGSGFSVRKLPMLGFGFQASGIYYRTASKTYFSLGYEELYVLNRTRSTALYLLAGVSYTYDRWDDVEWYDYQWDPNTQRNISVYHSGQRHLDRGFAGGAGLGLAVHFGNYERIWASFDMMMGAYQDQVVPYPQAAIHYLFK